ncbi:GrpB family protein [Roseococcus sp.]|uniref:GrpB family protein n=1 Tax=Roseococcus sp. TaxID=2109646 RepID=UPI003BAAF6D6
MDEVELLSYDPSWPARYDAEAERLLAALPEGLVLRMEHFGSTAVPGLLAKPVIDILVAVTSIEEAREQAVGPMEALGYAFWAENPRRHRLFFVKGLPPAAARRSHHVHMIEPSPEMWDLLLIRDILRDDPQEAARYAALKRELAVRHREDREAYTGAKAGYMAGLLARARGGSAPAS